MLNKTVIYTLIFSLFLCFSSYAEAALTIQQAVKKVLASHNGKVLKTAKTTIKNQKYYRIRLLTKDGRVLTFRVNAKSGKIIKE